MTTVDSLECRLTSLALELFGNDYSLEVSQTVGTAGNSLFVTSRGIFTR